MYKSAGDTIVGVVQTGAGKIMFRLPQDSGKLV